jgi:predicted RNA-binding Zn ribbon-like protein
MTDAAVPPGRAFTFVSGRPSVDLTATLRRRATGTSERLRSPGDLARWFVAAGLVVHEVPVSDRDLVDARELREALHRLYRARLDAVEIDPRDVALVNERAAHPAPAARLALGAGGRLVAVPGDQTAATLLAAVAHDGIDLLGTSLRDRVRQCAGEGCTLLFVDTSRAGGRRWCSMAICGARSKMAAYRRRLSE